MHPILLVLGPSGVGKSEISKTFENTYSFLHVDIDHDRDSKHGFELNHFPAQWDRDITLIDFMQLAEEIQRRVTQQSRTGAVISVPTIHVFSSRQLETARRSGLSPVVLWGTAQQCIQARRIRSKRNRKRFNEKDVERYQRKNKRTFETYSRSEYDQYHIIVFSPDGPHWTLEYNVGAVIHRTGCVLL